MRALMCDSLFRLLGHRACCRIPAWTARIGQPWRPVDEAPLNLYNAIWRVQQWVAAGMSD